MIRRRLKKHTFLLSGCLAVMAVFAISGYVVSMSLTASQIIDFMPNKNGVALLFWRLSLYAFVFFSWKPLLAFYAKNAETLHRKKKIKSLIACRYHLVLLVLFYEVIIVQNIISLVVGLWS